jgi:hypothetical protein
VWEEIFPNDTVKHSIVTDYNPSGYNIPTLQYTIIGHRINASDVKICVVVSRINEAITRLAFQIFASNAEVIGQLLSKSYNDLEITSAYSIYDRVTDKNDNSYTIECCIAVHGIITRHAA